MLEGRYPQVVGLVSRASGPAFFIPIGRVAELKPGLVRLSSGAVDVQRFSRRDGELLLVNDVLDRQVIDVKGTRVVRVNDLYLSRIGSVYRVVALDTGGHAILRRLMPGGLRGRFEGRSLIDWREVEYLASDTPTVRLRTGHLQLRKLRPQQLARILAGLSRQEGAEILSSLDEEQAADTLEEMSTEQQAHFLSALPVEQAADLIEEMEPDEAADILAKVPPAQAEALLEEMEEYESTAVRQLLTYDPDSAGGAMTNNVFRIGAGAAGERRAEDVRGRAVAAGSTGASSGVTVVLVIGLMLLVAAVPVWIAVRRARRPEAAPRGPRRRGKLGRGPGTSPAATSTPRLATGCSQRCAPRCAAAGSRCCVPPAGRRAWARHPQ